MVIQGLFIEWNSNNNQIKHFWALVPRVTDLWSVDPFIASGGP